MHPLTIKARGETNSGEGGKIREGIKGEQGKRKKSQERKTERRVNEEQTKKTKKRGK
jgi:hypothetical protein